MKPAIDLRKEITAITGIKELKVSEKQYLYFWYANSKGRGSNNCTIILSSDKNRASMSKNQKDIISIVKTSSWSGNVNFSNYVYGELFN